MRRLLIITTCCILLSAYSCGNGGKVDFSAANTAKAYYDHLLNGRYEQFVDGMDFPERIPDTYREQLILNVKMFVEEQQNEHRGLSDVRVVNCVNDSTKKGAYAYLLLVFKDSVMEEVVVPMVNRDGIWYMR